MSFGSDVGFFTFGDGSLAFRRAGLRIGSQFREFGEDYDVRVFSKKHLTREFPKECNTIEWGARGFGFWKWKPLALRLALRTFPLEVKTVIYADAGCWINANPTSAIRLDKYTDLAQDSGALTFSAGNDTSELKYSKAELLNYIPMPVHEIISVQRAGGLWILRRDVAQEFAENWWGICNTEDLVTDTLNPSIQSPFFVAHRHDQSIFSILAKKFQFPLSQDNIDIHPAWRDIGAEESSTPIWASRHHSGFRNLSMRPIDRAFRMIEQSLP